MKKSQVERIAQALAPLPGDETGMGGGAYRHAKRLRLRQTVLVGGLL